MIYCGKIRLVIRFGVYGDYGRLKERMQTYWLDMEDSSRWLRTTPGTAIVCPYVSTAGGHFFGRKQFVAVRNVRENWMVLYTTEGAGELEQGGQVTLLPTGKAVLVDSRSIHTLSTAPGAARWSFYWLNLDGSGVESMRELLMPGGQPTPTELPQEQAAALFDRVLDLMEKETTVSVLESSLVLHELLNEIARRIVTRGPDANRQTMERMADYIRAHYDQPLSLDELLTMTDMSKGYFLRLFRQYMGTTPYNFLLCTRITRAKELLVATDLSVSEISHRIGFENESNFSTRFTGMVGTSPLQFRKSVWHKKDDKRK